ncbi:MAG: SxtJ family membrane protein [Candidatus Omnitrophica bacterium]|nr:SxtJ family membrane protein [Candidatus Omnitrophota bacterium]MCM8800209.1 SxtJ family membrane protein [Candidatus Omnitrophota bacterium]
MERLDLSRKSLRRFTLMLVIVLFLWGTFLSLKHKEVYLYFYLIGLIFILIGLICPGLIKPLYIIWMRTAYVISWFITHLILIVLFYLIVTPYGLFMRMFGYDPLERKIEKRKDSYWKPKSKRGFNQKDFERLF